MANRCFGKPTNCACLGDRFISLTVFPEGMAFMQWN